MTRAKWARCPEGLTEREMKHWHRLAPKAIAAEDLHSGNVDRFKCLCRILALVEAASEEIQRDGVTIETGSGSRRPHPACAVLMQAQKQADDLLGRFGLS